MAAVDASDCPGRAAAQRARLIDQLARTYAAPLTRFFARRVRDAPAAADLVQDVLLRLSAVEHPDRILEPERYLYVSARNALRDRNRRSVAQGGALLALDAAPAPVDEITPARIVEARDTLRAVRAALLALPERTRDIFVLRVIEGLKVADLARAMGISTRAVEKHQARALAHVVAALGHGDD